MLCLATSSAVRAGVADTSAGSSVPAGEGAGAGSSCGAGAGAAAPWACREDQRLTQTCSAYAAACLLKPPSWRGRDSPSELHAEAGAAAGSGGAGRVNPSRRTSTQHVRHAHTDLCSDRQGEKRDGQHREAGHGFERTGLRGPPTRRTDACKGFRSWKQRLEWPEGAPLAVMSWGAMSQLSQRGVPYGARLPV